MHGASAASAATKVEPPDERVTILGSMVFVVGLMGAGTMGYRLYNFGEISAPVEPQQAPPGEAGSAEAGTDKEFVATITVRLSPPLPAHHHPRCKVDTCSAWPPTRQRRHAYGTACTLHIHCAHAARALRAHTGVRIAFTRGVVPSAGPPYAGPGRAAWTDALARR